MMSFSDYVPGSATASYRQAVDKAAEIAEQQKRMVDPIHHEKIDRLLDTYARRLAENMNQGYAITARVPSILIAGGSNFPVRQKEKQNRAADTNMAEWRQIQGLLDKIRGTGRGRHQRRRPGGCAEAEVEAGRAGAGTGADESGQRLLPEAQDPGWLSSAHPR